MGTFMVGIVSLELDRSQTFSAHFVIDRLPTTTHFTPKPHPTGHAGWVWKMTQGVKLWFQGKELHTLDLVIF